eukprot:TRINITY_DN8692_c1_g1_i13.p5 TRINITY_DN8692_c1_g1~~TRINITY_DN8692_c1_g1_i13.p5  ORF type:complete len:110 (-),score=1.03 TRINITY_DN8692_c1_g1_i13:564-893(-)
MDKRVFMYLTSGIAKNLERNALVYKWGQRKKKGSQQNYDRCGLNYRIIARTRVSNSLFVQVFEFAACLNFICLKFGFFHQNSKSKLQKQVLYTLYLYKNYRLYHQTYND